MSDEQIPASGKAEGEAKPLHEATPHNRETPHTINDTTAKAETPPAEASASPLKSEATLELVSVESPPLSPATESVPSPKPVLAAEAPAPETAAPVTPMMQKFGVTLPQFSRRTRWRAMIAASLLVAGGLGAAVAAVVVSRGVASSEAKMQASIAKEHAAAKEREQLQQTIAKLSKEVSALKNNLDNAAKTTSAQIGKLNERLAEKVKEDKAESARRAASSETTGSIAATPAVPVPTPRPQFVEARPAIVEGWTIRTAREGLVLVEGRGEIFEVVPGAPLPGLGRVESISRQPDGRWVVVTPKGLIVAANRPRPIY